MTATYVWYFTAERRQLPLRPGQAIRHDGAGRRAAKGAKSARVTYTVAAKDAVDGVLRPTCLPVSGRRFPLGRTSVTCEATDKSGNTATVKFLVTVRKAP